MTEKQDQNMSQVYLCLNKKRNKELLFYLQFLLNLNVRSYLADF